MLAYLWVNLTLWLKLCWFKEHIASVQVSDSKKQVTYVTWDRWIHFIKYWSSKRCVMGDDCNFAHSTKELRVADLTATQLCYAFSRTGRCSKGDTCTFAHGQKELRPVPLCREKEDRVKEEQIYLETLADTFRLKSYLINSSDLSDLSFRPPPGLDFPGFSYQCQSPLDNEDVSFASQDKHAVILRTVSHPQRSGFKMQDLVLTLTWGRGSFFVPRLFEQGKCFKCTALDSVFRAQCENFSDVAILVFHE